MLKTLAEALLHHGDQHLLLRLEVVERAARVHAGGLGDVADRRAVEALLAKQARAHAQQVRAAVAVLRRLPAGFPHFDASRGRSAGASISMRRSCAATALPRLSMRSERAAPPCSARLSTILRARRLSSGQSSTGPSQIALKCS